MSRHRPPSVTWPHRLLVWLLLFALPVYGSSGVLLQLLGPQHRHVEVTPDADPRPAPTLQDWLGPQLSAMLETVRAQRALLRHVAEAQPHHHHHGLFERHHHHAGDDSVVALGDAHAAGDAASDGSAASAGGGLLAMGPLTAGLVLAAVERRGDWPRISAGHWRSHAPGRLERPPRVG